VIAAHCGEPELVPAKTKNAGVPPTLVTSGSVAGVLALLMRWAFGSPKVESNSARSLLTVGSPKASMITIVWPAST
jgi:hypothetical protein